MLGEQETGRKGRRALMRKICVFIMKEQNFLQGKGNCRKSGKYLRGLIRSAKGGGNGELLQSAGLRMFICCLGWNESCFI